MNTANAINQALKHNEKPVILVGKPGDGKLNHLTSTLNYHCISLAYETEFPRDLVELARRHGIKRLVFDDVDRVAPALLSEFKEMLDKHDIHYILVTNNINGIDEAIKHRCLIFNLHNF